MRCRTIAEVIDNKERISRMQGNQKRRLRRVSSLDRDAGPSVSAVEEVPVPEFTDADTNGCDPSVADPNGCVVCVADANEGEEETAAAAREFVKDSQAAFVPSFVARVPLPKTSVP